MENFFIVRKPSGNLNNWVADAVFVNQTRNVRLSEPTFCLLNTGGIRSTLNKGEITKGDIYKLMPFDNELVWVKLPIEMLKDIEDYLMTKGGDEKWDERAGGGGSGSKDGKMKGREEGWEGGREVG